MADEAAVVEEGEGPAQSPLVSITFQRNVHRKQKYLEAEPKALGITQIGLSVFQVMALSVFMINGLRINGTNILIIIASLLVVIAGSVAIAAQNLHPPTLRACLGMQILACGASIHNIICNLVAWQPAPSYCWYHYDENNTLSFGELCQKIENTQSHFLAECLIIHVTLLAISATLAAYCCKVINCCTPEPKVPVITVQAPPTPQQ